MRKHFKWLVRNGRVLLLHRTVGFFGEQWETFGNFDDKDGNAERCKEIVKQLNQCVRHTESYKEND